MELINEADKQDAAQKLSTTILAYINSQQKFNKKLNLIAWLGLSILIATILIGSYLIYDREADIRIREQALTVREKLHTLTKQIDEDNLQKRREDVKFMMNKVFSQDSLNKLKNVQVDHVNTNTINTVNTKNVNLKK